VNTEQSQFTDKSLNHGTSYVSHFEPHTSKKRTSNFLRNQIARLFKPIINASSTIIAAAVRPSKKLLIGMSAFVASIPATPFDQATALPVQVYLWQGNELHLS
jgi:hypothetical protein